MAAEKNFETKIKKYLESQGCWYLKYWGGAAYTKSGIPDLLVCCNGFFLAVEVKAPNGKPSELQKHNIRKINDACGFAIVLQPEQFDDFKWLIKLLKESHTRDAPKVVDEINERWCI